MTTERNVMIARGEIPSLDEALAWAVQTYDREFTGSQMVRLNVEQHMTTTGDPDDTWRYVWTAVVSGMTETEGDGA